MLQLRNTLSGRVEPFVSLEPGQVRMYTCGPTVYRFVHIGNLRSYLMADWLRRLLIYLGYQVTHVKNITDVGHMRQDMVERGEDKMIAAALAEGKTPAQIAAFYTEAFRADEAALRILPAHVFPKATDHVPEMIALIERLEARGHTYEAGGNVYFDLASFPAYGRLSGNALEGLLQGVRAEADPLKRNAADFTLWKAAEPGRLVKWPSPWGDGFPGWHIECSAMAMRYLGEQFDLHTGGVDNIFPHHEGEIAQSEGATGRPFVRAWVHGQHLLADGQKMAKSTGNAYTLSELTARGFEPLAFRYLCLTVHYRARLNFTFNSLRAAQRALERLRERVRGLARQAQPDPTALTEAVGTAWRARLLEALATDLNLPAALGQLWRALADPALPAAGRLALVAEFDPIFGLDLLAAADRDTVAVAGPAVAAALDRRAGARRAGDYATADALRATILAAGWQVRDGRAGSTLHPRGRTSAMPRLISAAVEVPARLDEPDVADLSAVLLVNGYLDDTRRCIESLLAHHPAGTLEIVAVDNNSDDDTAAYLADLAAREPRLRLARTDHRLGEGEGRNLGLRLARGHLVLVLDTGVEVMGDLRPVLTAALADPAVGGAGRWGLVSDDMRHFHEATTSEVDALEGYCFAFRRALLGQVGWLDQRFRYYRNLDLDFSFQIRQHGYRLLRLPDLPVVMHIHRGWEELEPDERDRRSKRNFYRFLNKWHHREELLLARRAGTGDD